MLEWMLEPQSVYAITKELVEIEAEDTAIVVLKFESTFGIIEATTAVRPRDLEGSISVLGEKGSVVIEGFALNQMKTLDFVDKEVDDETVIVIQLTLMSMAMVIKHIMNMLLNVLIMILLN